MKKNEENMYLIDEEAKYLYKMIHVKKKHGAMQQILKFMR